MAEPQTFSDVLNNMRANLEAKKAAITPAPTEVSAGPVESAAKAPRAPRMKEIGRTSIQAFQKENPQLSSMVTGYNPGKGATREDFTSEAFGRYIEQHPYTQQMYGGAQSIPSSGATSIPFSDIYQPREKYGPPEMQGPKFDRIGPPMPEGQRYASPIGPRAPIDVTSSPRWDALRRILGPQIPVMGGRGTPMDVSSSPDWSRMSRPLEIDLKALHPDIANMVRDVAGMYSPSESRPVGATPLIQSAVQGQPLPAAGEPVRPVPAMRTLAQGVGPRVQAPGYSGMGWSAPTATEVPGLGPQSATPDMTTRYAQAIGPQPKPYGASMGDQMGKGYVPKGFWEGATIGGAPASEEASSLRKAAGAAGLAGAALTGGLGTWLRRTPAAIPVIEAGGIAEGVMNPESRFNQAARRTRENVREAYRTEGLPAAIAQQIGSIAPMTYETLGAAGAPFESMAGSAGRMAGSVLRNLAVGAGISESPTQAMARAREIYERDIAPTRPRQLPQISVPGAPSPAQNAPSLATAAAGAPSVAGRVTPGTGRPGATSGQQRGELDLSDMSFKEAFKTARDKAEQLGVEPTGRFMWRGNAYQTNVGPARGRERYVPESQQTRLGNLPQLADAIAPTPQPTPAPAGERITEVLPRSAPVTPAAPTAAAQPQGVLESLPDYAARQKAAQGYLGSRLAAGEGSRDRPIQLDVNAELTPETQRYLERHPEHRLASANPNLQREYVMIMRQLDELGVTEKEIRDATTTSTRDEISGGSLKGTVEHFVPDKFGGHFTGGRFWAPRQGERSGEKTVTGTRTERTDKKSTALDLLADWNRRNEEWNARQEKAEAVKPSAAEMSAQAKQNYKVLLLAERQARADKNFAVADQIKQQIADIEAAEAAFSR